MTLKFHSWPGLDTVKRRMYTEQQSKSLIPRLAVVWSPETDLDMFSMFSQAGTPKNDGPQRPGNVRQQHDIFCLFIRIDTRSVAWELIPFSALSRRGLNPIKLAYSPSPPDNGVTDCVSMPTVLVTGPTVTHNSPFLPWRWP